MVFSIPISFSEAPDTPVLISHGSHDAAINNGEIHVQVTPLERHRNGPITAYRVVVIDETQPAPFDPDNLVGWAEADEKGLNYYITAEVGPDYFDKTKEFVVGDLRLYGGYLNYGPLKAGRDYHVTVGAVSSLNNVTKATYAKVSHGQHAKDNLIVFEFHEHNHDETGHHHHDHDDEDGHDDHDTSNKNSSALNWQQSMEFQFNYDFRWW